MTADGFHYTAGTLTPAAFTPSDRKHHRTTGDGFMVTGREDTIRRNLRLYPMEEHIGT